VATRGKKPTDTYAGTVRRIVHAWTELFDDACNFVARNDGWPHKREIAVPYHQVTVAHAAGMDSDKYLALAGRRHSPLFQSGA
jgi:hypothetical protein